MESERIRSDRTHICEQSLCLPEEIVEDILSRLPVKSLLQFRCVSKPWRSLIGSEHFIKKHLDNSTRNPNFAQHHVILNASRPQPGLKQCSLTSLLNDPLTDRFTSCDLDNINLESIRIVGCCNGLVCLLLDSKHFMLWNPSTRKTNLLPDMDHKIEQGRIDNYGFGFDELSGDYVVFGIASITGRSESVCRVYSFETNSWKVVKVNISPFYNKERVFVSGKMHWSRNSGFDWHIISFDLRSEVFSVINLPVKDCDFYKSMGVVGGRLSLLYDDFAHIDIWVMKEYGVKESWEKVVTIPYLDTIPITPYLALLAIGPNGDILLTCGSCFEIFYPEGNGFRHCHVLDRTLFREAVLNVESLVPL